MIQTDLLGTRVLSGMAPFLPAPGGGDVRDKALGGPHPQSHPTGALPWTPLEARFTHHFLPRALPSPPPPPPGLCPCQA